MTVDQNLRDMKRTDAKGIRLQLARRFTDRYLQLGSITDMYINSLSNINFFGKGPTNLSWAVQIKHHLDILGYFHCLSNLGKETTALHTSTQLQ